MSKPRYCADCGSEIPADSPEGICRKCLLLVGMGDLDWDDVPPDGSRDGDRPKNPTTPGTVTYHATVPPLTSDRYAAQRFHARGGMGEVWLAKDSQIGRQVALKRLRRDRNPSQDRFLAEAQIAGQLEHPSVIPVHDLGMDGDGQIFYVMKFVEGRTLQHAVDDFHSGQGTQIAEREVERRRLLECFLDLCDAIAYAHSRGVIHRDIKPDNVMLGPFGETLVVDWGLAKVIDQPELPGLPGSQVVVTSSGRSAETQAGSVLGTAAYMPRELADGHAADVDTTCDVYLLGATLYYILTGQAPRRGSSNDEMLEMARTVPPVPPRQLKRDVSRSLEAICLKAMAWRSTERYPSAREVGDEVRRYLAGEPVSAYAEPMSMRAWRWVKRHRRRLSRSLIAAVMLGLVALSSVAFGLARRHEVIAQASPSFEIFRKDSDEAFFFFSSSDASEEQFRYFDVPRAESAIQRALDEASRWGPTLEDFPLDDRREEFKRWLYELLLLSAQLKLQKTSNSTILAKAEDHLDQASKLSAPTQGFYRLQAQHLRLLGDSELAEASERKSEDPTVRATALDHYLRGEQLRTSDTALLELQNPVVEMARRRDLGPAIAAYERAVEIDPQHYWSQLQLGRCRLGSGNPQQVAECLTSLGTCIALKPALPWGYSARGAALALQGRFPTALADLNRALAMDPAFLPAKLHRGWVHWRRDEISEAIKDLQDVWMAPPDRRLVQAAFYLGQIHLQRGDYDQAASYLSHFVEQDASFRPAFHELAHAEYLRGNVDRGNQHLNRFLELSTHSVFDAASPEAHTQRGQFLYLLAIDLKTSPALQKRLLSLAHDEYLKVDPPHRTVEYYYGFGITLQYRGQLNEAVAAFGEGLKLSPDNLGLLSRRARIHFDREQFGLAEQDYRRATGQQPKTINEQVLIPEAHAFLGILRSIERDQRAARDVIRAMISLNELPRGSEHEFLIWHMLACVFGKLSEQDEQERTVLQDLTIDLLAVGVRAAQAVGKQEQALLEIENEDPAYFGPSLTKRPEFIRLLDALRDRNRPGQ